MANRNAPSGFTPIRYVGGAPWNEQSNLYYIPASDTDAYYIGDVVSTTPGASDGRIQSTTSIGVPQIVKAAAGGTARGVIVGIEAVHTTLPVPYVPATKTHAYLVYVVDDPMVVFNLQANNTNALLPSASVNEFADFAVAAPSGSIGVSATVLDYSTIANNAALPLRILAARSSFSSYTNFAVLFNLHELG